MIFVSGEYGYGAFEPDTDTYLYLKTGFKFPPRVAMALTGFVGHLDVHSYDSYDGLSLDKYVSNVTTDTIHISAFDLSDGMVELTYVYCSWMACQGLEDDVVLQYY